MRDQLYALLSDPEESAQWHGAGDLRMVSLPDGTAIGMAIGGYSRWSKHRSALVNLIASTLRVSRNDVVDALPQLLKRGGRQIPFKLTGLLMNHIPLLR